MSRDGFLERWSRRKLAEGRAPELEPEAEQPTEEPEAVDEPDEEALDEEELAKLPSLESFTVKTDLAPFLRKGVPQALKNAAMRKMWMLDPAVRDHKDFAVDYAWDWNTPGGVPGNSGSISQDSIARMMDALNPKPNEPATARSDSLEDAPDAGENEATAASEMEPQSQAPAATLQEPTDESVSDASTPADKPVPRPRRHGGAAPV